jgi:hypothetical protein
VLSKTVCCKCVNRHSAYEWNSGEIYDGDSRFEFGSDDDQWDKGVVNCPYDLGYGDAAQVKGNPPEWCPYRFEHGVARGLVNAQT